MNYLLDINDLLAWEHARSPHHVAFHAWAGKLSARRLWTCAHTELGFLRVSMQVFEYSLPQASQALAALKQHTGGFVDHAPPPRLPAWASTAGKTSDAYLAQIAAENSLKLATFDLGLRHHGVEIIGLVRHS